VAVGFTRGPADGGSDASSARGPEGTTTMKMISSTSSTSMSGVTLMSAFGIF
jgi:hypothetical protein